MSYYCYFIISNNRTYIGITNNLLNRLKKHNGIIKGGAKSTRVSTNWTYHTIIGNFKNKADAMSFEWYWKHQYNEYKMKWIRTTSGINNKMKRLLELMLDDRWKYLKIIKKIEIIIY